MGSTSFTTEDFEMFTDREKVQIQDALAEFKRLVKEELEPIKKDMSQVKEGCEPIKNDLGHLDEKIEYLNESVNRLNRFDWKGVALSTIIGFVTNLSVDTTTAKHIYDLFQQVFGMASNLLPK